jgi:hypothetical protein
LTIEVSLLGPKVTQQIEKKEEEVTAQDKLLALCEYWHSHKLLSFERPLFLEDNWGEGEFVFERTMAHKFLFPKSKLTEISGLDYLVVWVAEPDPQDLTTEQFVYAGTFLILVETLYDREDFRLHLSGCSSLQALSNIITGQPFYTRNWDEPFGRRNLKHPFQKLESMGAIYLQQQVIQTIYRKRYMSNEQSFEYKGKGYRCNDLLAYPLFIN